MDKMFQIYINNAVYQKIPLFVTSFNKKMIFDEGVLKGSFWRSEDHLLSENDTEIFLRPNQGEKENDFDCSYGLNIFALMLHLNSETPDIFLPKEGGYLTRTTQKKNTEKGKKEGLSGSENLDPSEWRDHRLQIEKYGILDKIVEIFKQNFFKDLYTGEVFRLINYKLMMEINLIKTRIGFTNLYDVSMLKDLPQDLLGLNETLNKEIIKNENEPLIFIYCRVLEFIEFLKGILIGTPVKKGPALRSTQYEKSILLSELIYLFQYLLNFDYVIYILPSCRGCQEGQVPNVIPRTGGNTFKQRKTYKRKTNKRKVYKRKTYKRKTYKRKTYKRKRLN
jgi:hypothetical protein